MDGPIIPPVTVCRGGDALSSTGPISARAPTDRRKARLNTMVEWPKENQNPTDSGLCATFASILSVISLRVVLSTAAMWSASKA